MKRTVTPSFVLELKLNTNPRDERVLGKRFNVAQRIVNVLIRHAKKAVRSMRQDPEYRMLMERYTAIKDRVYASAKRERAEIGKQLSAVRFRYGLSEYQFHEYVSVQQHRYRKHIDSLTAQKLASDVWKSTESVIFGKGKHLRFKRPDDVVSVEGKNNTSGIRFKGGRMIWLGLSVQPRVKHGDMYAREALKHRVKFCRIVRKPLGKRDHCYLQLILEGTPPKKHKTGTGRVGIDPGTMSVAIVSGKECILTALDDGVRDYDRDISRLQRKLDRSRRQTNPGNFNPDGTVKRGPKKWAKSRTYRLTARKKRTLEWKRAASLKMHHETLADRILSLGNEVYTEDMDYKALQKRASKSEKDSRGRFKSRKRFGRSLKNGAPAMLLSVIDRKLGYEGKALHKVNTRTFRASQYNHVTDDYVKKRLSKRYNIIDRKWVQRDLYSAFLLMNADNTLEHADRVRCISTYAQFIKDHDRCIADLITGNKKILSSFGITRAA